MKASFESVGVKSSIPGLKNQAYPSSQTASVTSLLPIFSIF